MRQTMYCIIMAISLIAVFSSCARNPEETYDPDFKYQWNITGKVKCIQDSTFSAKTSFGISTPDTLIEARYLQFDNTGYLISDSATEGYELVKEYNGTSKEVRCLKEGKVITSEISQFDNRHNLIEVEYTDPEGVCTVTKYTYGSNDLESERVDYQNNQMVHRTTFEYDSNDRLTLETDYFETMTCSYETVYDDDNRPIEHRSRTRFNTGDSRDVEFFSKFEYNDKEGYYDIVQYELDAWDEDRDGDSEEQLLKSKTRCKLVDGLNGLDYLLEHYWISNVRYSYSRFSDHILWDRKRELQLDRNNNIIKAIEYEDGNATKIYVANIEYYN